MLEKFSQFRTERPRPVQERGNQEVYKFENGWGASIIEGRARGSKSLELITVRGASERADVFEQNFSGTSLVARDIAPGDDASLSRMLQIISDLPRRNTRV